MFWLPLPFNYLIIVRAVFERISVILNGHTLVVVILGDDNLVNNGQETHSIGDAQREKFLYA